MNPQPLICVSDVEASSRWYQRLLDCQSSHGGPEYERLMSGGRLILQLHRWDVEHHHGRLGDPASGPVEFDRRRLYLGEGCPSLFAYCTQVLHYSEHGAFNRIEVARAAARWPQLLECLADGSLHLAGARLLAPHRAAVSGARGRTARAAGRPVSRDQSIRAS